MNRRLPPPAALLMALLLALLAPSSLAQGAGPIRVNCGDGPYTDLAGRSWRPDGPYAPGPVGSGGFVGGNPLPPPGGAVRVIGNTPDPMLYITGRQGMSAYRFNVPGGDVMVRLGFAETEYHGPGFRSQTVSIEGTPVLVSFDTCAELGRLYSTVRRFLATVNDGVVDINFTAVTGIPAINTIEVHYPSPMAPPTPGNLQAYPGYAGLVLLDWSDAGGPAFEGYRVYRSTSPGGPFTQVGPSVVYESRYLDYSVTPAVPYYYRVTATDAYGNESGPTGTVSATPYTDAQTQLPILELTVDPQDLHTLYSNVQSDVYVPGTVTVMGDPLGYVDVRFRGNVSRNFPKKGWKLNLPAGVLHAGRDKLNLKSEFIEYSMIRDELAYSMYHALGVLAPTVQQVQMRLNGVYRGVYLDLEQLKTEYLDHHRLDPNGVIYKANSGLQTQATVVEYEARYEKETNTGDPYDDLILFIETINNTTLADFPRELAAVFDYQKYLDYWALQALIANTDFTFHNFYLYRNTMSDNWALIAWDNDHCFGNMGPFSTTIRTDTPIDPGSQASPIGPGGQMMPGNYNRLFDRMMQVDYFRHIYVRKMQALMAAEFSSAWLDPAIDAAAAHIQPDALCDAEKVGWEDPVPMQTSLQQIHTFVPLRTSFVQSEIPGYAPAYTQTLFINEVVTDNETVAVDEAGDFEDYIELYNSSGSPQAVGGLYLSDDGATPARWMIPQGTTIPAGGHIVIWCDEELLEGPLHASFKLSADGEEALLIDSNGSTLLDGVHWDRQFPDVAVARRGDGGAIFQALDPTPGAPNGTTAADLPPLLWSHARDPLTPAVGEAAVVTVVADDPALATVTLTYTTGGAPAVLAMVDDGQSGDGAAGDSRFGATIPGQLAGTQVSYHVLATDAAGNTARLPEGAGVFTYAVGVAVPTLVLNELMSSNSLTVADPAGEFDDWAELYNFGAAAVDIGGMFLSDDSLNPTKWQAPAGLVVPAGGHLLLWADEDELQGDSHMSFKLSSLGEELLLVAADGYTVVDSVIFPALGSDQAYGRATDNAPSWGVEAVATPGCPNGPVPCGGNCGFTCGDCTGDNLVTVLDALAAAQHGVGLLVLGPAEFDACDVDDNATVDVLDALAMARYAASLPVNLICCP